MRAPAGYSGRGFHFAHPYPALEYFVIMPNLAPLDTSESPRAVVSRGGAGGIYSPPPTLLDTREQLDQPGCKKAKNRTNTKAKSKVDLIKVVGQALYSNTLMGLDLLEYGKKASPTLEKWLIRLKQCGKKAYIRKCNADENIKVEVDCCHVPICPHEEVRTSAKWISRGTYLMKWLKQDDRWNKTKKKLLEHNVKIPPVNINGHSKLRWRFISFGLRGTGNLAQDIKAHMELRSRLYRYMKRVHNMVAGYIAVEVSSGQHVHLHALIYSPYIDYKVLKSWQQSQDCTKPDCKHEAGDRDCLGSWSVDIRNAWSPQDALKYACSPDPKGVEPLEFAKMRLAVYLLLYRKKRVQTYGLARPQAWREAEIKEERIEKGFCPDCGSEMPIVFIGDLKGWFYKWRANISDAPGQEGDFRNEQ